MKKVKVEKLRNITMAAGGEKKITKVIDGGNLKEWVGIGWITLRRATNEDLKQYPIVER